MGEIINLNKVRKAKALASAEESASQSRARSGLSKQIRDEAKRKTVRLEQTLDAKLLED